MGETTGIAWCDSTWNPWIGCAHISDACDHCYAETLNRLWKWNGGTWGPGEPREICAESSWNKPPLWDRKAATGVVGKDGRHWLVFGGDLCDLFDLEGPADARERMWALFRATPHLTWQVLTKRPENFSRFLPADWADGYPNVWLGVTAEDRVQARRRLGILRKTPARLRFVSFEPLLEGLPDLDLSGIDWAIVGGESGGKARPFDLAWARSIQAKCAKSGTAFFFKQLGANPVQDGDPFRILHPKEDGKRDASGAVPKNSPKDLRVRNWPKVR